jgi:5-epi-alpha-selinene synthase
VHAQHGCIEQSTKCIADARFGLLEQSVPAALDPMSHPITRVAAPNDPPAGASMNRARSRPVGGPPIDAPHLHCPIPSAIHPDANRIEGGTIAWMKRFGYIKTDMDEMAARRAQYGIRAARVHPVGHFEAIRLVSDLTVWLFMTDDAYIERAGRMNVLTVTTDHAMRSIRVLRDPLDMQIAVDPSLLALQDISLRLRRIATPEQIERLIGGMVEFFLAGCCEAIRFSRASLPKMAEYVPMRDAINCLRNVCFVFIELVGGFELPGAVWCRSDLQAVVDKATRIVSNHHDVLSGVRELADEVPMNLPAVLAQERDISLSKAFACVCDMANADMQDFIDMSRSLCQPGAHPGVTAYVEGLKAWIRGNLDWSETTGRYAVADRG